MRGFNERTPHQDEDEGRQEGEKRHHRRRQRARPEQALKPRDRLNPATHEPHEGHHHDQRPWCGFPQRQPIDHLLCVEPAKLFNGALVNIGQHRVGTAKRHERGLGEEPAHLRERALQAIQRQQDHHGDQPQPDAHHQHPHQLAAGEQRVGWCRGVVVDQGGRMGLRTAGMGRAQGEDLRPAPPSPMAHERCDQHDGGEGCIQREDGHKGRGGDGPEPSVFQRAAADAVCRVQHQRRHGRLDAVEHRGHPRQTAESDIDPRQQHQQQQGRQHEQGTGHQPSACAVQQPADVGGELLCFGPGQHHAEIQRMQEPLFADPVAALDELGVHDGHLPCRPAEADAAQLQPEPESFDKRHRGGTLAGVLRCWLRVCRVVHRPAVQQLRGGCSSPTRACHRQPRPCSPACPTPCRSARVSMASP